MESTGAADRILVARLAAYPAWGAHGLDEWQDRAMHRYILAAADASGFGREDRWSPGLALPQRPPEPVSISTVDPRIA